MKWKLQGGTITPESFAIAGGRATLEGNNWTVHYYITDHLGSTRAVANTSGNAFATFDYTPYGSLLNAEDTPTGTDYLFTGKENQAKQGAGELYDSQARFMDTGGRFLSIDPLAEKFYHLSPYAYCAGDPVNMVDPDGKAAKVLITAYKYSKKIYKIYRTQGKITPNALKKAGLSEFVDIAGDLHTVFSGNTSFGDKVAAIIDLVAGTEFNDKGKAEIAIFIDKSGIPQKITKSLRNNMKKATGLDPKDMDAHHMLPKKFNKQFEKAEIDINDPKYGIWLEKKPHYKKSNEYNQKWEKFFKGFEKNNSEPTAEEILTFMKQVMKETFDIDI